MIIACIGDVHGNLPALEAVLSHAQDHGALAIWNIGDFVGYGPFPDEVVQRLRDEGALSIRGNYDRKTLQVLEKQKKWLKTKSPEKLLAFQWAYEHLSPQSREYLAALPEQIRLFMKGWNVLLVHGSPADPDEHLSPSTPESRFNDLNKVAQADLVICGHSHRSFLRQVGSTWYINTGAVGRPDDGDPRAEYALLRLEPGSRQVAHYRVEYDVDRVVMEIRRCQLPETFAQMFSLGRDYGWFKKQDP